MSVFEGIDQLHIHDHFVTFAPDTAFQHIRHAQELADFAQSMRSRITKLHHRRPADHAKVADSRQARENVVLDAVREKRILFVVAEIRERQHRDAFLGNDFATRTAKQRPAKDQDRDQKEEDPDDYEIQQTTSAFPRAWIDIFITDKSFP